MPLQAVVLRRPTGAPRDVTGVFVVRDAVPTFTPVTTGITGGLDIEVGTLDRASRIVTGPYQTPRTLQDGARVTTTATP